MTPRGSKAAKKPSRQDADADDEDRISALPDAVLQHALGFLPSRDAVRTCVLGRRWRNLWRALRRLRIADVVPAPGSHDDRLHMFVNQLLLLREPGSILDECEIDLSTPEARYCPRYVDVWVRHALLLRARAMRVCLSSMEIGASLNRPLVSDFSKVLHIDSVCTEIPRVMDFSRCVALEDLEITSSVFVSGCKFISPSAKRLRFVDCSFGIDDYSWDERSSVSAQSLVCLKIDECSGLAPVLGSMPSLQAASIWVCCACEDQCEKLCSAGYCCDEQCLNCHEELDSLMDGCVLLRGLSNATSLKFRASFGMREKCALEAKIYSPTEQLFELRHLKILEIKCAKIDGRVQSTSKLIFSTLVTSNLKQFNIQTI